MAYGNIWAVEKTTVYIDQPTKRELEALAKRVGRPQAALLREALLAYIERQKRPSLPTFVASTAVGGDAAEDLRRHRKRAAAGGRT
jgi:Ribbon-helix-helix protein, copG family